jgi:hypothetical protein
VRGDGAQQDRDRQRLANSKRTPFRTLGEVIYTLGQAEFGALRFIVLQPVKAPAK